jgi:hypothetical protein
MPYFKMLQQYPNQDIAVFSSNYEIYHKPNQQKLLSILHQVPNQLFQLFLIASIIRHIKPLP